MPGVGARLRGASPRGQCEAVRTNPIKVVHVSPRVQAHGGIEALHLHHRLLPVEQVFVALVDRRPEPWASYVNLNFNWRTPLGRMRRDLARALAPHAGSVVIYHNAWCLPLLHAGDGAGRRLPYCLASPSFHARDLPGSAGLVDGAMGITPALTAAWPTMLPGIGADRTRVLPLPVEMPVALPPRPRTGELVIGHAGRIVREQKRLDRLPAFLRALDRTGLKYRFEVLGDGPLRASLQRELGDRVRFHGWTDKTEFWRVMAAWDAIVFFTDLEGGPIAMLEGMAAGAIPFYPRIGGSVGDAYAPQVDALCAYEPGDLAGLATNVQRVFAKTEDERTHLRARAQALVAGHTVAAYGEQLLAFVERIATMPRLSTSAANRRHWSDILPLGLVVRTMPSLLWQRR